MSNNKTITEQEFLESYDASRYDRPSVTVDMLVFTIANDHIENYRKLPEKLFQLLLIKRGEHPFRGQWALPGGFVRMNENLDEAAYRELKEETNVQNVHLEQLYTWGDVQRDPRTRVISASYMALADSSCIKLKSGDDSDEARWFTVSYSLLSEHKILNEKGYIFKRKYSLKLESETEVLSAVIEEEHVINGRNCITNWNIVESNKIAFDHAKIIACAIERLRGKMEYTDIAFHLMPEKFTLTQLQQVYEIILDKDLLKANFRRKIASLVTETNEYTKDAGHRPSKLFRYNPLWKYQTKH